MYLDDFIEKDNRNFLEKHDSGLQSLPKNVFCPTNFFAVRFFFY